MDPMSASDGVGRRARLLRFGASALLLFLPLGGVLVSGCSSSMTDEPGTLVVAVDSNVPLPGYIDRFILEVQQNGITMYGAQFFVIDGVPVSTDQTQLPGTLAVQNLGKAGEPVTVRLLGLSSQAGTAAASSLREVTTTVPSVGTSLLRLSLDALCFGETYGSFDIDQAFTDVPAAGAVGSCGVSETCVAGGCVTRMVATEPYDGGAITDGGTCFPVDPCFDDSPADEHGFEPLPSDGTACTVPVPMISGSDGTLVPATQDQLNVGVPLPSADCNGSTAATCLAPLDSVSPSDVPLSGFYVANGLVYLPSGLCAPTAGIPRHTVVEVSTACTAKTVDHPLCAPSTRIVTKEPMGSGEPSPAGANANSSFSGTVLADGGVAPSGSTTAYSGGDGGTGTSTTSGDGGSSDAGAGDGGADDGGPTDGGDGGEDEGGEDGGDGGHEAGADGGAEDSGILPLLTHEEVGFFDCFVGSGCQ